MRARRTTGWAAVAAAALLIAAPAAAATATPALAASGFGTCSILQAGKTKVVSGKVYKCVHIAGVGWLWIYQGPFPGCAAAHVARLCG